MARHFSNWIDAYLNHTQHSEAPESFHRWSGVATIAGVLRRRAFISMGYFKWFPNFFLFFVAPPGVVSKSTTVEIGMSLLRQVPDVKMGPSAITWQALITSLVESRQDFPIPGTDEFEPMCAVTIVATELGTLIVPNDQTMLNVLTDLWDCKDDPFQKVTKGGGTELVINPWVQLIGCTTPAWIAENFGAFFVSGGLASRILFVFQEHKRQLVAYPQLLRRQAEDLAPRLIEDLTDMLSVQGEYLLTPEAFEWGAAWYHSHHSSDNRLRLDPRFGGYFARKQAHIHKLAMVLSASRGSDMTITRQDLELAHTYVTELEPNMLSVYGQINKEKITGQMAEILVVAREAGVVRREYLYHHFIYKMGYATFNECLDGLIAAGLLEIAQEGSNLVLRYKGGAIEKRIEE